MERTCFHIDNEDKFVAGRDDVLTQRELGIEKGKFGTIRMVDDVGGGPGDHAEGLLRNVAQICFDHLVKILLNLWANVNQR